MSGLGRRGVLAWLLPAIIVPLDAAVAQPGWEQDRRRRREYERWREAERRRRQRDAHHHRQPRHPNSWDERREREAWAQRQSWYR